MSDSGKYTIMAIVLKINTERNQSCMKTSAVQIRYSSDKLRVLRKHMEDEKLQAGLEALLQDLYEKHVPAKVREALDQQSRKAAL